MKGLEYLKTVNGGRDCSVYTDSLSVLQALANPINNNPIICKLKNNIVALEQVCKIFFYFVRGHSGNFGNELADQFADSARRYGIYVPMKKSKKYIKTHLLNQARLVWNRDWGVDGAHCHLYQWVPSTLSIPPCFPPGYYLTQLLTGHGRFPFYFYRFNIRSNKDCFCEIECSDLSHYFDSCPATLKYMNQLNLTLNNTHQKQKVLQYKAKLDILIDMIRHINITLD